MTFPKRRRSAIGAALALLLVSTAQAQTQPATPPPLDPESPMAPLPDLGVDWPDLNKADPITPLPDAPVEVVVEAADDQRYSTVVAGIETLPEAVTVRFNELSTLREGEGKPANVAQINRRARDDAELLDTILRAEGYYDANIDTDVAAKDGRLVVTLTVEPGPIYKFDQVQVTGVPKTDVEAAFGVKANDPVNADKVIGGELALKDKLAREGFPFAKVPEPEIVVDHDTRIATLKLNVDSGGERRIGKINVIGDRAPFGAKHVQTIARFRPGDRYDQSMMDDLRRAIIATGLVSSVKIEPVPGATPETVDIAATIDPAPFRTIAGEVGYGTGEGFRVAASWQHRNLIKPEGAVTLRGVAGTREQSIGALLRMGNFRRRDQVLNASMIAAHEIRAAYDATSFGIAASLARQTSIIWQKDWTYSFGFELLATDEKDFVPTVGIADRRTYFIGALPLTLGYDGSDDLLDPTKGFRLSGRVSPEVSLSGKTFGYVRSQVDASGYIPVGKRTVIAGRARIGITAGAARDDIAPSRLFYAGGGGSVRGYGYQEIGPRNVLDQPIGGRSLAEFSLEARIRLPIFGGNFGVVPFVDAGNIYPGSLPSFTGMRVGAGVGLRYYSNFGPIRIDVGTPLGRRKGESLIAVQVSLGQAF
jgi:translocation and assembly module TamA